MRTPGSLLVALALGAALSACGDDPRPSLSRAASPSSSASPSGFASAAPSVAPSRTASVPPPSATTTGGTAPAPAVEVALTGDGIEVAGQLLEFGTPFAEAEPALRTALGAPTRDTGETSSSNSYGTCPGSRLRALEFSGGALYVLFGDVPSAGLRMYQWSLTSRGTPEQAPLARPRVGDDAIGLAFGVGSSVADLRSVAQGGGLEVRPGDEMLDASFSLRDRSPGFVGFLTGTADTDRVTGVVGGQACGE